MRLNVLIAGYALLSGSAAIAGVNKEFCDKLSAAQHAKTDALWGQVYSAGKNEMQDLFRLEARNLRTSNDPNIELKVFIQGKSEPLVSLVQANLSNSHPSDMVRRIRGIQREFGISDQKTGDWFAKELQKPGGPGISSSAVWQLTEGDRADPTLPDAALKKILYGAAYESWVMPRIKQCEELRANATAPAQPAAPPAAPARRAPATRKKVLSREEEKSLCEGLVEALKPIPGRDPALAQNSEVGRKERNEKWNKVYALEPELKASYSHDVRYLPATSDIAVGIRFNPPGGMDPIPLRSSQLGEGSQYKLPAKVGMLRVFSSEFGFTEGAVNGRTLAEELKKQEGNNLPQSVFDSLANAPIGNDISKEVRKEAWELAYDNIYKPRLNRCEAAGFKDGKDFDQIARNAINGVAGTKLVGCKWVDQPKAFVAGCGAFCTGTAKCVYEENNQKLPEVHRTIGCKASSTKGDQVSCGQASSCHNDRIDYVFANKAVVTSEPTARARAGR